MKRTMDMKRWLAVLLFTFAAAGAHADPPEIVLAIGSHNVTADVASSDPHRMQGLMHRRMLPENRGMLFVFSDVTMHGMWMMNTYVPLSVAFLDTNGVIINIEDMEPQTQTTHGTMRPAKYALEVNRGWFRKRGIKPGEKVQGLEKAGPAR